MSERWWRRRKRLDPWFGDFLDDSDNMENDINEMIRRVLGTSKPQKKKKKTYPSSFSTALASDDSLRFRKFANPQSKHLPNRAKENREPLVDVIQEDKEVVVLADLHGVKQEDVQIHATQCDLMISVDTSECKYHKDLALPAKTDPASALATFKNGVLQIRLKKLIDTPLYNE